MTSDGAAARAIRRAGAADLAAYVLLVNDYIDQTGWLARAKSRDVVAAMFVPDLLQERVVLLAVMARQITGYLSVPATGRVGARCPAAGLRGHRIGKRLLHALKALHRDGLTLTTHEPNDGARRCYARQGLLEVPGRRCDATDKGVPALLLRWPGGAA